VLLTIDVAVGRPQIAMQVRPLGRREVAVGLVGALFAPDVALLVLEVSGFRARELPGLDAFVDPRLLVELTMIDPRIAVAREANQILLTAPSRACLRMLGPVCVRSVAPEARVVTKCFEFRNGKDSLHAGWTPPMARIP